ncbi:MAG TPA: hypothetical protein VI999_04030 [Thermoplasmata archaeon]|nr:hypothetical protein [Thermoplasmata archaeon]
MDPSGVLLALEEQKKWRERRKRIEERIKQLGHRKAYLERELGRARKMISDYSAVLTGFNSPRLRERPMTPPAIR